MAENNGNIQWHLSWGGQTYGPFDLETIRGKAASGELDLKLSHAWRPGYEGWKPCLEVGELAALQSLVAPPPPPPVSPPPPPGIGKVLSTGTVGGGDEEQKAEAGAGRDPEPFPAAGQEDRWTKGLEPSWAIPLTFDYGHISGFSEGVAIVEDCGKYGIIDGKGEWVVRPTFDEARNFSEGLARVKLGGKLGYIDGKGSWIVRPTFEEAWHFYGGLAAVKLDGKWGFIDRKGEWVVRPTFDKAGSFFEGLGAVELDGKWGFIDRKGQWVVRPAFGNAGYFSEGLAPVKLDGKLGYIKRKGEWVIPPAFDGVVSFSEGLARVKLDGKYGFIDRNGQWVVRPTFDETESFSEGLLPVSLAGQWGVLNLSELVPVNGQIQEDAHPVDVLEAALKQYGTKSGFHLAENLEGWISRRVRRAFGLESDRVLFAFAGDPEEPFDSGIIFTDTYACTRGPKGDTRMEYAEWSKGKMDQVRSMVARTVEDPEGRFRDGEFWRLLQALLESSPG